MKAGRVEFLSDLGPIREDRRRALQQRESARGIGVYEKGKIFKRCSSALGPALAKAESLHQSGGTIGIAGRV